MAKNTPQNNSASTGASGDKVRDAEVEEEKKDDDKKDDDKKS